jgi:dipeptidyl aminopeptidase/acylaminoacyl peptidase
MKPVTFAARDGLKLHAYLTLPLGKKKPLPMVLLVHGGPWTRDRWRFDPQAQWLANRGYACLQVNFRGSTGFGKKFVSAGNKEWGRKMQDDLTDAVAWAVRKKIADPKRVGIMGASYGGYAALAGAAFTPDYHQNKEQSEISAVPMTSKKTDRSIGTPGLFKCAVDQFGPSDLAALIRAMPAFWADEKITALERVGDPGTEADLLKERSPLYHADKIQIPVLIAQGVNDAQTPRTESDRMVEALRQRKIECEYWVFPDEGHGFLKPENRIKFFRAAEIFLARHLGGRFES